MESGSGIDMEIIKGENEMLPVAFGAAEDEKSLGESHLAEVQAETALCRTNEEAHSPKVKTAL